MIFNLYAKAHIVRLEHFREMPGIHNSGEMHTCMYVPTLQIKFCSTCVMNIPAILGSRKRTRYFSTFWCCINALYSFFLSLTTDLSAATAPSFLSRSWVELASKSCNTRSSLLHISFSSLMETWPVSARLHKAKTVAFANEQALVHLPDSPSFSLGCFSVN